MQNAVFENVLAQYSANLRCTSDPYFWAAKDKLAQVSMADFCIDERVSELLWVVADNLRLLHLEVRQDLKDKADALLVDLADTPFVYQILIVKSMIYQINQPAQPLGSSATRLY